VTGIVDESKNCVLLSCVLLIFSSKETKSTETHFLKSLKNLECAFKTSM
jgi:hypothetical protein